MLTTLRTLWSTFQKKIVRAVRTVLGTGSDEKATALNLNRSMSYADIVIRGDRQVGKTYEGITFAEALARRGNNVLYIAYSVDHIRSVRDRIRHPWPPHSLEVVGQVTYESLAGLRYDYIFYDSRQATPELLSRLRTCCRRLVYVVN